MPDKLARKLDQAAERLGSTWLAGPPGRVGVAPRHPSPEPAEIAELGLTAALARDGVLGRRHPGGARRRRGPARVEAVIDKDLSPALLARELGAGALSTGPHLTTGDITAALVAASAHALARSHAGEVSPPGLMALCGHMVTAK